MIYILDYNRYKKEAEECGATSLSDWEEKHKWSYKAAYERNWHIFIAEDLGWEVQPQPKIRGGSQ